jgi:hypothetical protein
VQGYGCQKPKQIVGVWCFGNRATIPFHPGDASKARQQYATMCPEEARVHKCPMLLAVFSYFLSPWNFCELGVAMHAGAEEASSAES